VLRPPRRSDPARSIVVGQASENPRQSLCREKARAKRLRRHLHGRGRTSAPHGASSISAAYSLTVRSAEADGLRRRSARCSASASASSASVVPAGQATAFEHLLAGEDLLAVIPTGSGKSLLYQLTSLVGPRDGGGRPLSRA